MGAHDITRDWGSGSPFVLPVELSDGELLNATRSLVGRSNQLLALLLGHLAELEARGLHRTRACSSLYTYCIYELRLSEDEAYRRVAAARLVRRFPALLDAVASGELHLTGLLMLGPHLSLDNLTEVLARAKHRTKKEVARLVRQLDPLPDVPARCGLEQKHTRVQNKPPQKSRPRPRFRCGTWPCEVPPNRTTFGSVLATFRSSRASAGDMRQSSRASAGDMCRRPFGAPSSSATRGAAHSLMA
ncbi:MAG TPA: hypothetical protein VFQ61_26025 [Polyangiaceae bacterium]|nr:hypothetical protein [Polyangiaceae bacterium]